MVNKYPHVVGGDYLACKNKLFIFKTERVSLILRIVNIFVAYECLLFKAIIHSAPKNGGRITVPVISMKNYLHSQPTCLPFASVVTGVASKSEHFFSDSLLMEYSYSSVTVPAT